MAQFNIPVLGWNKDKSSVGINVDDAAGDAALTALFNAVVGVIKGETGQSTLVTSVQKNAGTGLQSADPGAQKEMKWLCRINDATLGKTYRFEIPTADFDALPVNSDFLDLTAGVGLALKTAFDAIGQSSYGNGATLISVELVGRTA